MAIKTTQKRAHKKEKPWWNRPLWGDKGLLERFKHWFFKPAVPETAINIHNNAFLQLKNIAAIAKSIDNYKLSSQEFYYYLKVKNLLTNGVDDYEGLSESLGLLKVALEAKDSFMKIEQIEMRYLGFKQKEFYDFVFELLKQETPKENFRPLVQKKLVQSVLSIKSEDGKTALQAYMKALEVISKHDLGLRLLYLFKQYDLGDFATIRTISDLASDLYYNKDEKDLQDLKEFQYIARVNSDVFDRLAEIISIPKTKDPIYTYAIMLQYIGLSLKYQDSFVQFQQLISIMKNWKEYYKPVEATRIEYNPRDYAIPEEFTQEIPGLDIYQKYQQYTEEEANSEEN